MQSNGNCAILRAELVLHQVRCRELTWCNCYTYDYQQIYSWRSVELGRVKYVCVCICVLHRL